MVQWIVALSPWVKPQGRETDPCLHLVSRLRVVKLHLHCRTHLQGVVINYVSLSVTFLIYYPRLIEGRD
jgi:hypothetical protein